MMLHEILPMVQKMLGDIGCDHVTITRDTHRSCSQLRLYPRSILEPGGPDPGIDGRLWLDGTQETPTRGTRKGYIGWALWSGFGGFSVRDVLSHDWRIIE
jgi:hypothetical protein